MIALRLVENVEHVGGGTQQNLTREVPGTDTAE